MSEEVIDLNEFLDEEQKATEKKPKEPKSKRKYSGRIELSNKMFVGSTLIYKPVLDKCKRPFRRISGLNEVHIKIPDDNGTDKWQHFTYLSDPNGYTNMNAMLQKKYNQLVELANKVSLWGSPNGWVKSRKNYTIFYALGLSLKDKDGNEVFKEPELKLFCHSSAGFVKSFLTAREAKAQTKKKNPGWISKYFDVNDNNNIMSVTTKKADIGFDVSVQFDYDEDGTYEFPQEATYAEFINDLATEVCPTELVEATLDYRIKQLETWIAQESQQTTAKPAPAGAVETKKDIENKKFTTVQEGEHVDETPKKSTVPEKADDSEDAPPPAPPAD